MQQLLSPWHPQKACTATLFPPPVPLPSTKWVTILDSKVDPHESNADIYGFHETKRQLGSCPCRSSFWREHLPQPFEGHLTFIQGYKGLQSKVDVSPCWAVKCQDYGRSTVNWTTAFIQAHYIFVSIRWILIDQAYNCGFMELWGRVYTYGSSSADMSQKCDSRRVSDRH